MTTSAEPPFANIVLNSLESRDLAMLRPHLTAVSLPLKRVLEVGGRRVAKVYFLESGIASVVTTSTAGEEMEVGLIGREGMTGLPLALGNDRWPYTVFMQASGSGHVIDTEILLDLKTRNPRINAALLKSVQAFLVQVAATATSRVQGRVDERLARWLLMAHDRVGCDEMDLTHQFLAVMLGVRRAGVTVALQALSDRALVKTGRGTIKVIDRQGLERFTRGLYGGAELEHERLFPRR